MTLQCAPAATDRDRLIELHIPLARSLARRYSRGGEPFEDLEQTAYVGLVKAADRYDAARGAFPAFAVPTILGELRRHFRDRGWAVRVPRRLQERAQAVEREADALAAQLGRSPTAAEIGERLGLRREEVVEAHHAAAGHFAVPFVTERDADGDADGAMDPGAVDDGFVRAEERAALVPMLGSLRPHERRIVLLRFHGELSQQEIGRMVGISQMGVSRILRRSLARMRDVADEA
jgi:RNA polymerase sigma-B factor